MPTVPNKQHKHPMKILMVCLGNICRSPLAEGILKEKLKRHGLDWHVDSAGTGAYHVGELPDPRSIATARKNGIDITDQRARQIKAQDLHEFDLILTMDQSNQRKVLRLAPNSDLHKKVVPILNYVEEEALKDVPDPYWDDDGFDYVFQLLDSATDALLETFPPPTKK